jgi:monoamine oxidase
MNRSRRRFLTVSTLAAASGFRARRSDAKQAPTADAPVVIVGAGLAGLRAAEIIRDAGLPVVVLEASARPGGRVRTARAEFDEGLHAEFGALRIAGAHDAVRRAIRAHSLGLVPFDSAQGAALTVVNGRGVTSPDEGRRLWSLDLKPDEAALSQRDLLERYVGTLPSDLGDPAVALASYDRWQDYDRLTWPEWLRARGASADAIKMMTLGGDASEVSALYVLRQFALLGNSTQRYKIDGGMDRLPRAMAAGLGDRVRYQSAVMRIARDPGGFRIEFERIGRRERLRASRVVCAVPLTTLRRIEREPRWSPAKEALIEQMAYYPVLRVLAQARTRFWVREGHNGAARTDRGTEIWDATHDQLGRTRGILGAAVGGAMAREASKLSVAEALEFGIDRVEDAHPSIRREQPPQRAFIQRWDLDPWARGAFVAGRPGQMTTLLRHAAEQEDGIHFAGEHTSAWMGWMEGALLSGERAGREVLEAV